MDHSGHGGMDHGDGGMDHGGGMGGKCSMNMLWNTQIVDTCVVFPQWHIRSNTDFVVSFLVIVAIGVFYEWLRGFQRTADVQIARSLDQAKGKGRVVRGRSSPSPDPEDTSLLTGRRLSKLTLLSPPARVTRAALYGATVFLSFFLMLVFMTYNAYLILAVVLGAGIGHYVFGGYMDVDSVLSGGSKDAKGMACH
ncbi:Ctr copper transporter [Rickenella mellea]|uniref:Copper transport protein n=1 Tax=Rickenella mellea TaxID=50990 RepID=A0A4Y7PQ93_9AGAM|nr:Ctr copper transporter [Rickenella mellea]